MKVHVERVTVLKADAIGQAFAPGRVDWTTCARASHSSRTGTSGSRTYTSSEWHLLLAAGRPDLVKRRWVERVLAKQEHDGGWIESWYGWGPRLFEVRLQKPRPAVSHHRAGEVDTLHTQVSILRLDRLQIPLSPAGEFCAPGRIFPLRHQRTSRALAFHAYLARHGCCSATRREEKA